MLSFIFANKNKYNMDKIELLHGDCFNAIESLENGSINMILTDPPYEISNSGGGMMDRDNRNFIRNIDSMGMAKSSFDVIKFLNICIPKFKDLQSFNGVFFLSLKQLHLYIQFAIDNKLQYGLTYWHKSDPAPLCNNKYLNDIELCIYIKGKKARIMGNYSTKSMVYKSATNRKDKKLYEHPTIKPVELIEKYLINHSNESDIILDPFMGSGTTGVACINTNRNFIGIELDDKYFDIAKTRISETVKQHYDKGELDERAYNSLINFDA